MFMEYVRQIVGRIKWRKYSKTCLISTFVTVSDEALTLLALDNSEFVWEAQALKHTNIPSPKYTCARASRRVSDGWSFEGRNKFNYYFDLVRENRTTMNRARFETLYLSHVSNALSASITSDGSKSIVKMPCVIPKDELGFSSEYTSVTTAAV